ADRHHRLRDHYPGLADPPVGLVWQAGDGAGLTHMSRLWLLPLALLAVPLATNDYTQYMINLTLVYVLIGVGFNVVIGNLGQLAFANAAFYGIGAYATGILLYHYQVPLLLAIAAGGIAGGMAGALVALPALRGIRSFYLAI